MHEFCAPNVRCDASHNGTRCAKSANHAGWHQAGLVEWLDRELAITSPPCSTVITLDDRRVACTEPEGHRGAHRGDNLIWTDPTPSPEEL